jgi:hypothetical protein
MTAPIEIFAYELIIPWEAARWVLLLVTVYSIIWVLGLYASLRVLPYRLEAEGLRVYYGVLADGLVPYSALADAVAARGKAPEGREGVRVAADGQLYLAAGGRTDVTLRLRAPVALRGLLKPTPPPTVLHLAADDPPGQVAALRARAGLPAPTGPAPVAVRSPSPAAVTSPSQPPSLYVEARR